MEYLISLSIFVIVHQYDIIIILLYYCNILFKVSAILYQK